MIEAYKVPVVSPGTIDADSKDPYLIQSLARGLRVLSAFSPVKPELSQGDIADIAGVSAPSALRIGHTLVKLGYLTRNESTRGYRLGPGVLTLGMATLSSMTLVDIAEPHLGALRDQTGESVKMAVLHGTSMIYISRFASRLHAPSNVQIGTLLSAANTSAGKAMLSRMSQEEALRIIEDSAQQSLTPRTVTSMNQLMSQIRDAAEKGYAINDQEVTLEHRSVGAALIGTSGKPVAAISVSASARRVTVDEMESRFAPPLVETAHRISALLPPDIDVAPWEMDVRLPTTASGFAQT